MAIGLSNVNNRKAKRPASADPSKSSGKVSRIATAAEPAELRTDDEKQSDAWSTRGLAREGRSARRERSGSIGDLNMFWLDWSSCVTGKETPSKVLQMARQLLNLETFVFEFLVYDLQIPARSKKRILGIRSRGARILQLRKLLARG